MRNYTIILALSLFFIGQINAQIITDRPDQTESSSTVGGGDLQVESGLLISYEGQYNSNRQLLAPTNLFRYGITDAIELRLLSQFEILNRDNDKIEGISDLQIGTKIQLLRKEDVNTEIALLSHLIVPTGTPELLTGYFGTINKLSISHSLTEKMGIGYNVGYNYFGEGWGDLTYSVALGISVNDKVGVYIEPYGDLVEFETYISNFDTGFTYLANENVQLDFSFGTGLNQKMNYISVGCSWLMLNGSSQ